MAVLESFETYVSNIPQDLGWSLSVAPSITYGSSGLNVTQGSASMVWQTASGNDGSMETGFDVDVTGATEISIDVTISTMSAGGSFILTVNNLSKETATDATTAGSTGTFTLTADISAFTSKNAVRISLYLDASGAGNPLLYMDNLRDNAAGGGGTGKINLGGTTINKIMLGSTEIKKVYLGTLTVHDTV